MNSAEAAPRLLIVDDEEALAKLMQRTLRSRGFESDVALTAAEARRQFEAGDYALAVLDVRLPDESGYGLLEELRSKRPDTAVVMISGVDDPELGKAAVEHGAHGYYVKPIGSTELYLAVYNALRRRNLELDDSLAGKPEVTLAGVFDRTAAISPRRVKNSRTSFSA